MSHELRTPLNAIIGFSEVMDKQLFGSLGNPRYERYVSDIHCSGGHLLELINEILDVARIEAGHYRITEEPIALPDLIDYCISMIGTRAEQGGIQISTVLEEQGLGLRADSRALRQILINLLSNAVKFTPPGGRVEVTVRRDQEGGVAISIADTGIGMAAEDIPRALQPFGQLDTSLSRIREGAGLGLPLAKMLTELHNASLRIQSAPGQGTTITLRFPPWRVL
jgi:signal transduction histidine kinase